MNDDHKPRVMCYRCSRPLVVCFCDQIELVSNKTRVVILQHAHERSHPIGTARIARLGLQNCELDVRWTDDRSSQNKPVVIPPKSALLYPSPNSSELHSGLREDIKTLVVIDGSWMNAKSLLRVTPELSVLPCYHLHPQTRSGYQVRRAPRPECLSTIESIVEALTILEPNTSGLDGLLEVFHGMVATQIECAKNERRVRETPRQG